MTTSTQNCYACICSVSPCVEFLQEPSQKHYFREYLQNEKHKVRMLNTKLARDGLISSRLAKKIQIQIEIQTIVLFTPLSQDSYLRDVIIACEEFQQLGSSHRQT